jgi:hypothetical protein
MSDTASDRPAQLWKRMNDEQRRRAAEAFWADQDSPGEQAEVLALIARKLNFRLKSARALPNDRKSRHLISMGNVSDAIASRLLVTYHLAHERTMMGAFLDLLGIAHENGLIADDVTPKPDPERLRAAVAKLRESFPVENVDLYFATLAMQDPETWGALRP